MAATQWTDFTLSVPGEISIFNAVAFDKVVVPADCYLTQIAIITSDATDDDVVLEVYKNGAVLSPRVVATFLDADLEAFDGFVFDMTNATDESEVSNSLADRPWFQAGDAIHLLSDGGGTTGSDAKCTLTFRRSSL